MNRSEVNRIIRAAQQCFKANGWALPPEPKWDVTDFGMRNFSSTGLVLVNLAEEPEYCEKVMYATKNQLTPSHMHKKKKEDIICRAGILAVQVWEQDPYGASSQNAMEVRVNGVSALMPSGQTISLQPGERITIEPGMWHAFSPATAECIISEVSTANDDLNDNFFSNPAIGRFSEINEDEPPIVNLVSDNIYEKRDLS